MFNHENRHIIRRLEMLIDEFADGKYTVFAKNIGATGAAFTKYLDGRAVPSISNLIKISLYCGVSLNWLIFGLEPKELTGPLPKSKTFDESFSIPYLESITVKGSKVDFKYSNKNNYITSKSNLDETRNYFVWKIQDNSLFPSIIKNDLVMVEKTESINLISEFPLIVLAICGESKQTVVRYYKDGYLLPSNILDYEPEKANAVIGRIIHLERSLT